MKKISDLIYDLSFKIEEPTAIAIGNFDGVHNGHQKVLEKLRNLKKSKGVETVVLTFTPHPIEVVRPDKKFSLIIGDYSDKLNIIENFGIDYTIVQRFSDQFRELTPDQFLDILSKKLNVKYIIVGDDYTFGKNRAGDINYLKKVSSKYGFEIVLISEVASNSDRVTSSYLRKMLKKGDIFSANRYLAEPFFIKGYVEAGYGRGKQMGYPTANIKPYSSKQLIPGKGVYITTFEYKKIKYRSVTSVGVNPTFDNEKISIETYVFDFNKDIYFEKIKLYFLKKIRDEKRFNSIEELIEEIDKDCSIADQFFNNNKNLKGVI